MIGRRLLGVLLVLALLGPVVTLVGALAPRAAAQPAQPQLPSQQPIAAAQ